MSSVACDPNFSLVSALLHCDGTNGSTSFPDSSSNSLAITVSGTVQVTSTNPEFGNGCASYANSGGLAFPFSTNGPVDLSTGDWTIEFWMNPGVQVGGQGAILYTSDGQFSLYYNKGNSDFSGQIGGAGAGPVVNSLLQGNWYAIALVCASSKLTTYINGVRFGSSLNMGTRGTQSAPLNIGNDGSQPFTGSIDEVRITKGLALYSGASYVVSGPFPSVVCFPTVPNIVGLTRTAAIAALTAAGFQYTITEVNQTHPTVPAGSVVSQIAPAGTSYLHIGDNVTISISTGPPLTAGMGGDVWGTTGGSNVVNAAPPSIGQTLATAQHQANAIVQGNQSVLSSLATGARISQGAAVVPVAPIIQATPDTSVPTTPTAG